VLARKEMAPLTKSHGGFDLTAAYAVQDRGIALELGEMQVRAT
jgi:hypothetical protein